MQRIFHKFRPLGILPAFAWLIMQILMTGAFLPSIADAEVLGFDSTVTICTPNGLKSLSLDGEPTEPGDATRPGCDWCQAFGNTAPLGAPGTVLKVAFDSEPYFYQLTYHQTGANKYTGKSTAIRAPPTLNL
jgi:hypothetical protein